MPEVNDMEADNGKTRITAVRQLPSGVVRGRDCLVEIYGKSIGRKFDLDEEYITLGRDPDNHIVVDTDSVSRRHARIEDLRGSKYIVDMQSTNGTYVNDKLIDRTKLSHGDYIKIGDTIFKHLSGQDIESAYHEEIYRMTIRDGLTRIANKRYFQEFLDREFSRCVRYGRGLVLLMLDIDHFKQVNDQYGHLTGDYVLRELANVIQNRMRREELFARYGGEEFAVVLPECSPGQAVEFATILRDMIANHTFEFEGNAVPITVSIGIASLDPSMKLPEDLVRKADEKLYEAKNRGRNIVVA